VAQNHIPSDHFPVSRLGQVESVSTTGLQWMYPPAKPVLMHASSKRLGRPLRSILVRCRTGCAGIGGQFPRGRWSANGIRHQSPRYWQGSRLWSADFSGRNRGRDTPLIPLICGPRKAWVSHLKAPSVVPVPRPVAL